MCVCVCVCVCVCAERPVCIDLGSDSFPVFLVELITTVITCIIKRVLTNAIRSCVFTK